MDNLNSIISCSQVCRNWRAAYQALIRPETLCVYFQKFIPLNHRPFYLNERVFRLHFLKMPSPADHEIRFLSSDITRIYFKSLKKLVIFSPFEFRDGGEDSLFQIRFGNQLNYFKLLEYVEIRCEVRMLERSEIDLPNLKVLSFRFISCEFTKNKKIILKTPLLESMRIQVGYGRLGKRPFRMSNLKFLFPHQLKYLDITSGETDFKFNTEFPNLEQLVFAYKKPFLGLDAMYEEQCKAKAERARGIFREVRVFGEDFLESLPSLKLLAFKKYRGFDLPKLKAEKLKFTRKNLKILEFSQLYKDLPREFDYQNWGGYVNELRYWPDNLDLVFDKLLKYKIPLVLFEEKNFFRISELVVRRVADQELLVDFLRKTKVAVLHLGYDCNLGQSFFDEIADSVPLKALFLDESVWCRFSDFSVLRRLNMFSFELNFRQFRPDATLAVLNNPACFKYAFILYDRLIGMGKGRRMEPRLLWDRSHRIQRVRERKDLDSFYCETCEWKDPNGRLECSIEVIEHLWSEETPSNMTREE